MMTRLLKWHSSRKTINNLIIIFWLVGDGDGDGDEEAGTLMTQLLGSALAKN